MEKKKYFMIGIFLIFLVIPVGCSGDQNDAPAWAEDLANSIVEAIPASETQVVSRWNTSGTLVHENEVDSWIISAGRINGNSQRAVTIDADRYLAIDSSSTGGSISLTITQNEVIKTFDLTAESEVVIVLASYFEPGVIQLQLDFDESRDVYVNLAW